MHDAEAELAEHAENLPLVPDPSLRRAPAAQVDALARTPARAARGEYKRAQFTQQRLVIVARRRCVRRHEESFADVDFVIADVLDAAYGKEFQRRLHELKPLVPFGKEQDERAREVACGEEAGQSVGEPVEVAVAPVVRYPEALAREFFATAEQAVRREELQDAPAPSEEAFEYDGRREGFGQHAPAFEEESFGRDGDATKFDEARRRDDALKLALEERRVFRTEVRGKFSLRDEALAYDGRFVVWRVVRSEHVGASPRRARASARARAAHGQVVGRQKNLAVLAVVADGDDALRDDAVDVELGSEQRPEVVEVCARVNVRPAGI